MARCDGDEIGCAKDAVDSSLVDSCLVGSGGEVSWAVKAETMLCMWLRETLQGGVLK